MGEIVAFDLETTGLRSNIDEILEIGAYKIIDGAVKDKFHRYVRPMNTIPDFITNINGITNEMVADEEPIEVVLPEFYNFCGKATLLGHNIKAFDFRWLLDKGVDCGLDFSLNNTRMGYDTLILARKFLRKPEDIENHKLETLIHHFKIMVSGDKEAFHTAWYDAYASWLIYQRFKIIYGASATVPELLSESSGSVQYGQASNIETLSYT